jgi:hypothetical protein
MRADLNGAKTPTTNFIAAHAAEKPVTTLWPGAAALAYRSHGDRRLTSSHHRAREAGRPGSAAALPPQASWRNRGPEPKALVVLLSILIHGDLQDSHRPGAPLTTYGPPLAADEGGSHHDVWISYTFEYICVHTYSVGPYWFV